MSWLVQSRVTGRARFMSTALMRTYSFATKAEANQQASWLRRRYGGYWSVRESDGPVQHIKRMVEPARERNNT